MDKKEFELGKMALSARRYESTINLLKVGAICGTILFAFKLILDGCVPLLAKNASEINALAQFVQSFHLGSIFGYILCAVFGVCWAHERRGKQRAVSQKAEFQKQLEQHEPNRTSSGLTPLGHTPKTNE